MMRSAYNTYGASARSDKIAGIGVAVALHAVVIIAMLQYAPARTAIINAVPLMVSLITPPAPKPDVLPKPLPMKPAPQQKPNVTPPQSVLAAAADAPSTVSVPPPPPAAPPAPIEAPSVAAAPQAAPSAKPAPVVPPNFNANYYSATKI